MSIRLRIWLGAMACAAVLVVVLVALVVLLGRWAIALPPVSLSLAGVVVLLAFAPVAWVLARLAYHPVRDVTKTARSIAATGQLDRRCFYPGPRDDVGELVITVNELLVRYDAAIGRLRRLQAAASACSCSQTAGAPDPADLVVVDLMDRDATGSGGPPTGRAGG
jgi:hypothetical protein